LCIRDFEAVRAGALLMKPDMDHIETWPDIFVKNESYASFSWDAGDLMSTADHFLNDEKKRKEIARNAFASYRKQAAEMPGRFRGIIDEIEKS
jgi:hypothetical protein